MNAENERRVYERLEDHETRLRMVEIGVAKMMAWIGVGTVVVNILITIALKVLLK